MRESDDEIIKDLEQAIEEGRELEGARGVPGRASRNLTVTFAIRLSSAEHKEFSQAAEARGMSLADLMRSATRAAIKGEIDADTAQRINDARKAAQELTEALSRL